MDKFVNLHVHTIASLQDSVIRPADLIRKVKEYEQSAVAVTDHGSVASWIEMNNLAQDVKIIFGNEMYCVPEYVKNRERDHLVLLAKNNKGLINIRRLQRIAVENQYYKPLLSYELLKENDTEGIYATSACSLSTISKKILSNDFEAGAEYCHFFNDIFDGFSLELQFHPNYPDQKIINEGLVKLSDELNIPLTVSCDCHFLDESDRELRKIVQTIAWRKKWSDDISESLKSNCVGNSDLVRQFAKESGFEHEDIVEKAILQTNDIAASCNAKLEEPQRRIPKFDKISEMNELFEAVEW